MKKFCRKPECSWPECARDCGLVPNEDYVAGSCPEEELIHELQHEIHEWRMLALKYANTLNQIKEEIAELTN